MKNKLLFSLLSITTVLIILSIFFFRTKTYFVEKYISPNQIPPNYQKYNTNLTSIASDPSGQPLDFDPKTKRYNYTQTYYIFLVQLMQSLSKNAKKFDKILVKDHAKNTLSPETIEKLDIMIKPLLKVINESAKMVDFWAVGYESLKEYQVKNLRYKIYEVDCFLYDRLNWTEIRVLLQLIEDPTDSAVGKFNCRFETSPDKKNVAEETTPEFPTYPIGYPSNEQLIPLPSQVIITEKMVLDMDGISFPVKCPYKSLAVNWIEIVGSNLTLNAFSEEKGKQLQGMNKIPFDYTAWKGSNDPIELPNKQTNQWPTLKDQPKNLKAWPSTPVPFVWDLHGNRPIVHPTRRSPGIRTALKQQPLVASYDPSMFDYPRKITEYKWMFDNANVIPALEYEGY